MIFVFALSGFLLIGSLGLWLGLGWSRRFGPKSGEPQPNKPLQPPSGTGRSSQTWRMANAARS